MPTLLLFSLLIFAPFVTPSPPPAPASATNATTSATCPLDLTFASTFPWDETSCLHATSNLTDCCTTLRGLLGIAFAERLSKSGLFRLPNASTSAACLADLASEISAPPLSLNSSLVSSCFPDPGIFVVTKDFCAGILTKSEWDAKVGNDSDLDAACGGDLTVTSTCLSCFSSGSDVSTRLTKIDGNISHSLNCFYLMAVYVAGAVNQYGPYDPRNVGCTFGLAIDWDRARSSSSKSHSAAIYASVAAAAAVVLAICAVGLSIWRHNMKKKKERRASRRSESEILALERSLKSPHPRPHTGSIWLELKELEKATDYFSQRNLIGRGGFGVVYKGTLADGTVVAVKRMLQPDMEGSDEEFRNEVEIISHLRHRNLVPLRGCCIADDDEDPEEGRQRYLVYDYMPNGSLDDHIFSSPVAVNEGSSSNNGGSVRKRKPLTWPQRKNIILDVAKGLAYLHYGVKPSIYHRDIKSTNILLDGEMRARVADFGLARQSPEGQTHMTTRVAGTHGYLAPEYALYGQLTEKSDVYSFGVLLLETLSGRRALDMSGPSNMILITDWAWTQVKAGRGEEVLDEALLRGGGEASANPKAIMTRFVMVGILCSHVMVALRPTISDALKMLEGDIDVPEIPDRPLPLAHGSIYGDGRTFASSSMVSGPSLDTGDMLR